MDREDFLKRVLDQNIEVISALRYSPDAIPHYDILCDAIVWLDELPDADANDAMGFVRYMLRLRIEGAKLGTYVPYPIWSYFQKRVPEWPGFRVERCDARSLLAYYEQLYVPLNLPPD